MKSRRILSVLALLVVVLALASPAYAQGGERPGLVAFGRDLTIAGGEVINGDVVAFGGSITIEPLAKVTGDVVAFGGNVTQSGEVSGSLISFGGDVDLRAGSVVLKDVVALDGQVIQAEGARVGGNVSKGFVFSFDEWQPGGFMSPRVIVPPDAFVRGPESLLASIILGMLRAVLTVLVLTAVAVVLMAIFPKPVEGVRSTLAAQPAASAGIGCLAYLAAAAISIPLFVTCIGPFLLWTAIAIAFVFGLAALGLWLGERLSAATGGRFSPLTSAALGTATVVLLLAVVDIVPVLNCFGWVLWLLVGSLALGAVVWSRFGTQLPPGVPGSPAAVLATAAPAAPNWPTPLSTAGGAAAQPSAPTTVPPTAPSVDMSATQADGPTGTSVPPASAG